MAPNIHPVLFVANSSRDAADFVTALNHDGFDFAVTLQFKSGSEARRTGSDYDGNSLFHKLTLTGQNPTAESVDLLQSDTSVPASLVEMALGWSARELRNATDLTIDCASLRVSWTL